MLTHNCGVEPAINWVMDHEQVHLDVNTLQRSCAGHVLILFYRSHNLISKAVPLRTLTSMSPWRSHRSILQRRPHSQLPASRRPRQRQRSRRCWACRQTRRGLCTLTGRRRTHMWWACRARPRCRRTGRCVDRVDFTGLHMQNGFAVRCSGVQRLLRCDSLLRVPWPCPASPGGRASRAHAVQTQGLPSWGLGRRQRRLSQESRRTSHVNATDA